MTLREAYQVLGLQPEATPAQVKAAYRRLAAEAHPDRGGRTSDFIRIRAAYEILSVAERPDDEIPVPPGLREVIDAIVNDFREQQRWAETETLAYLDNFERTMQSHIRTASRSDLRQFSATFSNGWDAVITALFGACNSRCDGIVQRYESWYTENTKAFFDSLHRKELLRFPLRRRFWEVFVILGALAGALSVVIGWEGPWRRWVSVGTILAAAVIAFLVHWFTARRRREVREKAEPLSVVVFELDESARFPTEAALRRGRLTTAALGLAGMFLGGAAAGGFAVPVVGAVAGAALGGAVDRFLNPTARMRESMELDLARFMAVARTQVTAYVLEAHQELLGQVRGQIEDNYRSRVQESVRLLTAGGDR
ncbi:MAG: DnaJ domain-containing protein [Thermoleophilia bacterium]|nr:DnaJ domain-containing protein [Thermoleophilia bacterium]